MPLTFWHTESKVEFKQTRSPGRVFVFVVEQCLNVAWTRPSDLEPSFSTRVASSALAWLLPGRAALRDERVSPAKSRLCIHDDAYPRLTSWATIVPAFGLRILPAWKWVLTLA